MFCTKCGQEIPAGGTKCTRCGNEIKRKKIDENSIVRVIVKRKRTFSAMLIPIKVKLDEQEIGEVKNNSTIEFEMKNDMYHTITFSLRSYRKYGATSPTHYFEVTESKSIKCSKECKKLYIEIGAKTGAWKTKPVIFNITEEK